MTDPGNGKTYIAPWETPLAAGSRKYAVSGYRSFWTR